MTKTRDRLTKAEEKVIQWAFNVADSIVAGNYNIPQPMIFAINRLQDAAWDVAKERGSTPRDLASEEYRKVADEYWGGVYERLLLNK